MKPRTPRADTEYVSEPNSPNWSMAAPMASIPVRGRTTVFTAPTLENRIMKDRTMAAPHMPPVYDHQGAEPIPSEDMDMSVPVKIHSARRNTMPVRNEMNDARTGEPTFLPRAVFTGDCTRTIIPERMPKTARITRSMSVLPPYVGLSFIPLSIFGICPRGNGPRRRSNEIV